MSKEHKYSVYAYRMIVEACEVRATSVKDALERAEFAEWIRVDSLKPDSPHLVHDHETGKDHNIDNDEETT